MRDGRARLPARRGHRPLRRRRSASRRGCSTSSASERVIDTPIAEEGFVGAAFGAAWMGERPIVELQFADFVSCAFDPIVTRRRQDALAPRHPAAGRDPLAVRRRRARRPVPRVARPRAGSAAPPGSRSSPGQRRRRLRAAAQRDRGRRPGALLRAQGALPAAARRGAGRRSPRADRHARASRASGSDVTVVTYGVGRRPRAARRRGAGRRGLDRGRRPAHRCGRSTARRSSRRSRARRALLRAAGGGSLDRRRERRAARSSRREGFELLDAPPVDRTRRSTRRCRSRPSSRTPTSRRARAGS